MRIIGLTGRSGSGKSTVAAFYRSQGYPVADADQVARRVLEPGSACLPALVRRFGADILDEQGRVRRPLLAHRAYADPGHTRALVEITHPEIVRRLLEMAQQARQGGADLFFADGAVIVGAPFERHCDAIVLVSAPEADCVRRIRERDDLTVEEARARLAAQLPEERLRAAANEEIRNDSGQAALLLRAAAVLEHLKGGA
ncbi:dephospho-CoA kinase [Allofournierella sp.]|uniref:dephospho-CoA kinase n=1 Tax=Allofournierella sp. TaxID=1940256 RepID=UPI003AB6E0D8